MRYENIGPVIFLQFIQKVIYALGNAEHGFAVAERIDKALLCLEKFLAAARASALPDTEILFNKAGLEANGDPCDL